MSLNKATNRKLQILSGEYRESHQLDLLSLVTEQISELHTNDKKTRVTTSKAQPIISKVSSYHCHGNVDINNNFSNFTTATGFNSDSYGLCFCR